MDKPVTFLSPEIVLLRVGFSNSALVVNGHNSILIDTGVGEHLQQFISLFTKHNLAPADIRLIVLTHTHYDHTGNLHELVKLTGAKVIVHKNEFKNLKNGFTPIPKGVVLKTRIVSRLGKWFTPKYASPKPFTADLVNKGEFNLKEFKIDGKIISTPGHTNGSQSVLIGKKLIAGDTFLNLKDGTVFPIFASQPKILLKTWQTIFDLGVDEIYPGHGQKIKVKDVFPEFNRWKKKLKVL